MKLVSILLNVFLVLFLPFQSKCQSTVAFVEIQKAISYYNRGDNETAAKLLIKNKDSGYMTGEAYNILGDMYYNGNGLKRNYVESEIWYRKSAEMGNNLGQHSLAYLYYTGRGVVKNDREALKWYIKACDNGNTLSCTVVESWDKWYNKN